MKCKSSFAAGGPGSPLSETRSAGEGCTAPVGANPEDGVGVPRPAPRPGRSAEGGPGARETQVQLRPERGGARNAGRQPRRGFKCIPGSEPAALGASSACSASGREFPVPRGSQDPTPSPSRPPAWSVNRGARMGRAPRSRSSSSPVRTHGRGAPQGRRGGSAWKRSSTSSPRCSEWNLEWAGNWWNAQPALLQPASLC